MRLPSRAVVWQFEFQSFESIRDAVETVTARMAKVFRIL